MDHREELLRTQAMVACLNAMKTNEVNIYGNDPTTWTGSVLVSADTICTTTHWATPGGRWRYDVLVRVEVVRSPVEEASPGTLRT